ncbi:hypothetical protein DY000_02035178 [Brassica cretica]|uniref:Uncharacterized protein n=1 Tax=Brassica cretica TaxID=69181 RepID=A0ABQ7DNH4_BRACR|nr:hypothetical protein DY000_02035178 [Brassica cretica]
MSCGIGNEVVFAIAVQENHQSRITNAIERIANTIRDERAAERTPSARTIGRTPRSESK